MKVLWFVSSLEKKGGGERFVLEGVNAIRSIGHDVRIVCDRLNDAASFDGRYDLTGVLCTAQDYDPKAGYLSRAFSKIGGLLALYRVVRNERPDLVICQSEFDTIKLYGLSKLLRFKYRTFVFGQMFQFKIDISKYSSVFHQHLETVMASRPGYRDTVMMPPPRLSAPVWLVNEAVSRLKRRALRSAERVFAVSNQVKWEVGLLYGRDAQVCRAAYDESYIDARAISAPRPVAKPARFVSVCRLTEKKRVDLTIRAFSTAKVPALLTIIGFGPEEARLRELAAAGERADSIRFLGAVSDEVLQAELAVADCFISMDIADYNISVVEAMGKGLRVLVASDFDLTEFGSDFTGVRSVEPEVSALSRAMDSLTTMTPPSATNLNVLRRLTWQHLAGECVAP
jgi:glycosyltransferase involved in cell wall biosynthesis